MLWRSLALGVVLMALLAIRPAQAQAHAHVRLIVALADVPNVDVFWAGREIAGNFDFGSISVYLDVPAGTRDVRVALAGQGIGAAIGSTRIEAAAGQFYTLAIVGQRDKVQFHSFEDMPTPPSTGQARLRVIHAAPALDPIAVHVARGDMLVDSLAFAQGSAYLELAGGTYQLQITAAQSRKPLEQRDRRLQAGTIYDLVMLEQAGRALVELDTYTPVRVLPATGEAAGLVAVLGGVALLLLLAGSVLRRGRAQLPC